MSTHELFESLGLQVLQRGWLSSNNLVFRSSTATPAAVVDTGHACHAAQTQALVLHALDGEAPGLVVNTHLHSDHCGGNAALQAATPGLRTLVPDGSLRAVQDWDEAALGYGSVEQRCDRFAADAPAVPGEQLRLGEATWELLAAPGHDPLALMLYEPESRVLIAGDALWEQRLAIVFPELDTNGQGFDAVERTLDAIEALAPAVVIPGHGPPFIDVPAAIEASRARLSAFRAEPARHASYACRALCSYHVLERGEVDADEVIAWMLRAPVLRAALRQIASAHALSAPRASASASASASAAASAAYELVERLVQEGTLRRDERGMLRAAAAP